MNGAEKGVDFKPGRPTDKINSQVKRPLGHLRLKAIRRQMMARI